MARAVAGRPGPSTSRWRRVKAAARRPARGRAPVGFYERMLRSGTPRPGPSPSIVAVAAAPAARSLGGGVACSPPAARAGSCVDRRRRRRPTGRAPPVERGRRRRRSAGRRRAAGGEPVPRCARRATVDWDELPDGVRSDRGRRRDLGRPHHRGGRRRVDRAERDGVVYTLRQRASSTPVGRSASSTPSSPRRGRADERGASSTAACERSPRRQHPRRRPASGGP